MPLTLGDKDEMMNVASIWIDVEYDALVNISWAFLNVRKGFIKKKVEQT